MRKPLSSAWQRHAVDFGGLLQRIIGCFTAALESMAGAGIVPTIPELGGAPAWQPGAVMRSRRVRTALAAGDHHRRTGAEPGVAGDRLQAVLIAAFGALEPGPAPGTISITLHFGAVPLNRHDTIFIEIGRLQNRAGGIVTGPNPHLDVMFQSQIGRIEKRGLWCQ